MKGLKKHCSKKKKKTQKKKTNIRELQFGKVLHSGLQAGVREHFGAMQVAAPCHGALHWWL